MFVCGQCDKRLSKIAIPAIFLNPVNTVIIYQRYHAVNWAVPLCSSHKSGKQIVPIGFKKSLVKHREDWKDDRDA